MRCSSSSAVAVAACAWPEGSLGLDWMTPWEPRGRQTKSGCRCECGSRDQNQQRTVVKQPGSQSVQSMQAGLLYPEEGFQVRSREPAMMTKRRSSLVF